MNPDIIKFYEEHPWKLKASRRSIFFPEFDIISVETRNLYRFLKAQHPVLRRFKHSIHYVPNGVDSERLSPFLRSYESKQDIILYVGRITHHPKRSGILLEAFAGISAEFPNWRLLLIGPMESGFRRYFEDFLAKNRGIQDRISYVGVIEKERSRLYEYYSKAKIFAFPSESEGFSIAMLEAGAFGDVTVGSDIPSIRELTNNGSLGYLCPINDIDCFIDTLRYALTHEEDLKKKSEDIARFVRDNFNWGKICATLDRAIVERIEERVSQLAS